MGTIVLSPQDCFSSHNNRRSFYFPSAAMPDTGKRRSQALMVPLPTAEDCARHDLSGGSPPGDGLLPIPQSHGQARALSKKPTFPSKPSSMFCTPRAGRTPAPAASPPIVKKLSRSASAILPTPLVGSPPGVQGDGSHLLKGRLPFKIVQGNGPGISKADAVQRNSSKKPNEARSGAPKKLSATNGHATNVKVKGGLQGPTSKPLNEGAFLKGQPKKVDEKDDRRLQRSHSAKGPGETHDQNGGIPVITILQRPQSKEAAAELLTKFLQKSVEQEVGCVDERPVNCIAEDLRHHPEIIGESEIEEHKSRDVLSDSEAYKDRLGRSLSSSRRTSDLLGAVTSNYLQGSPTADAVKLAVSPTMDTQSEAVSFKSRGTSGDVCEELASWERWAGPCYINSPPPSALPLPRFSKRQLRIESIATPGLFEEIISERASTTPPSCISPLYACLSDRHQLGSVNSDAVVTATKDLKRILNLDLCRM